MSGPKSEDYKAGYAAAYQELRAIIEESGDASHVRSCECPPCALLRDLAAVATRYTVPGRSRRRP